VLLNETDVLGGTSSVHVLDCTGLPLGVLVNAITYPMPWPDRPLTDEDRLVVEALARQLAEYACDGSRGRPEKGDPVYDSVTEHRDFGHGYSSCGDLAHWMLYRLGVRLDWINRREHHGWKQGVNLSLLAWNGIARAPNHSDRFLPGDVIIVWNKPGGTDGHVMVVLEDRVSEVEVAQYGAPGGKISTPVRSVQSGLRTQRLGLRQVQRWLPLLDVLHAAQARGLLVAAEDPTRDAEGNPTWPC
jgi:hypothetical protein